MSQSTTPGKRKRLGRREFLMMLGVGAAGVFVGVKLGTPIIRLRLAEWVESSGGPPTDIDAPPDAWFEITPDNRIRLFLPKAEMGQGVHTGLAQIAADELEIEWDQLEVVHAATNKLADPVATSASTTIAGLYLPLRETAATLREMLIGEAARQLNLPVEELVAKSGIVSAKKDTNQKITYGELFQYADQWELPDQTPVLKPLDQHRFIGKSMPRVDLVSKINGQAIYGYDVRLPDMLYGAVARPKTIDGKLKSARPGSAASQPGVVKVVIEDGFAGIVAKSRIQAQQALEKLDVEWDLGRTWQQSEIEAMTMVGKGEGVLIQKEGDPEEALLEGSIVEAEYRTPMAFHAYLEPLAAAADVRSDGVTIYASTQAAVRLRGKVAEAIGRDESEVVVQPVYLGGGLGRKIDELAAVEAARLSQAAGKPVHLGFTRQDDFRSGFVRPPTHHRLRAVLDNAGHIHGMEHLQASGQVAFPFLPSFMSSVMGADFGSWRGALINYDIANMQTVAWLVDLPVPTGWWRGLGLMANVFAIESFIDELAFAANIDPLEFRLQHLPKNEKGNRIGAALNAAADKAGWGNPLPAGQGRGIAVSYDYGTIMVEIAEVSVEKDQIQVHRITAAADPGLIVNPDGVIAQTEGGITMGVSASLHEEVIIEDGEFQAGNFDRYPLLRNADAPEIDVVLINSGEKPFGMGEPPIGPVPAAIANAVFAAVGKRLRRLPLRMA